MSASDAASRQDFHRITSHCAHARAFYKEISDGIYRNPSRFSLSDTDTPNDGAIRLVAAPPPKVRQGSLMPWTVGAICLLLTALALLFQGFSSFNRHSALVHLRFSSDFVDLDNLPSAVSLRIRELGYFAASEAAVLSDYIVSEAMVEAVKSDVALAGILDGPSQTAVLGNNACIDFKDLVDCWKSIVLVSPDQLSRSLTIDVSTYDMAGSRSIAQAIVSHLQLNADRIVRLGSTDLVGRVQSHMSAKLHDLDDVDAGINQITEALEAMVRQHGGTPLSQLVRLFLKKFELEVRLIQAREEAELTSIDASYNKQFAVEREISDVADGIRKAIGDILDSTSRSTYGPAVQNLLTQERKFDSLVERKASFSKNVRVVRQSVLELEQFFSKQNDVRFESEIVDGPTYPADKSVWMTSMLLVAAMLLAAFSVLVVQIGKRLHSHVDSRRGKLVLTHV
ncbi:hypothetical protein [Mesorhizobium sp. IMUNJ 23232]|uniref:hypothetical protein n=1 Tax=Mesorhizobium sp. IMUNJ 23232 TaxID=3376064 RepID=UPI00379D5FFE